MNHTPPPTTSPPAPPVRPAVDELEIVLTELLARHEDLHALAKSHRAAISAADSTALSVAVARQSAVVQQIAALEARRGAAVERLAPATPPAPGAAPPGRKIQAAAPAPILLSQVIARLPAAAAERIAALADRLRALLETLHREHAAIKAAAEALAVHMDAIMKQVGRRLSHSGTYGRAGLVSSGVQVVSALDLRS